MALLRRRLQPVEDMHPEHVYPKGVALRKWRRDELQSSHAELHNGRGWHTHDESKRDLMAELERSLRLHSARQKRSS